MQPISAPFKISTENKKKFVGIGKPQWHSFFKQIFEYCKFGKLYVFTVKEMTAAEVQRNYFHLCMFIASREIGVTPTQLKSLYDDAVLNRTIGGQDNNFPACDWVIEVVDFRTGEIIKQTVPTFSTWTTSMLKNYIDLFQTSIIETYPNFIFPSVKDYEGEIKGKRNELLFPESETVFNY